MSTQGISTRKQRLSDAKRALLERRLRGGKGHEVRAAGASAEPIYITPDEARRHEPFPLTDIQQAYWLGRGDSFALGNVSSHGYLELDCSHLDLPRFERAWQRLIERHDMLRAVVQPNGTQQVLPGVPAYRIEAIDLRDLERQQADTELDALRAELSHQILPSDRWPLFDVRAALIDDVCTRIYFSVDLLIMDAASIQRIGRELYALYQDPSAVPPPLALSFRDYVLAERALSDTEAYRKAHAYWRRRLPTLPAAPELPLRIAPAEVDTPRFVRRTHALTADTWTRIKAKAQRLGVSHSAVAATLFGEVLARWSKSPRFSINVTLFNRQPLHPQVGELVGDFTSLTMLAVDGQGGGCFADRARALQAQLWEDLDHSQVSGVAVLRDLARSQGRGQVDANRHMPVVFTSTLAQMSASATAGDAQRASSWAADRPGAPGMNGLGKVAYSISQTPQVWLDHQVSEQDGALITYWDAVEELFPQGLLDDMCRAYVDLAQLLAASDGAWELPALELLPPYQRQLVRETNVTEAKIEPRLLHAAIWERAASSPDAPAVINGEVELSYRELCRRAAKIGNHLRAIGVSRAEPVVMVMDKGWAEVVAALGIIAGGGAYVPLDAAWPESRIADLIAETEARMVLTQVHHRENKAWPEGIQVLAVDDDGVWEGCDDALPAPVQEPQDLAYIIFTSGSTGKPKGVMIDHRGAYNTVADINARFDVGPQDRVLGLSAMNFDLSVYDVFGVLAAGGTLVLPDADKRRDPDHWLQLLCSTNICNSCGTVFHSVTQWWHRSWSQ